MTSLWYHQARRSKLETLGRLLSASFACSRAYWLLEKHKCTVVTCKRPAAICGRRRRGVSKPKRERTKGRARRQNSDEDGVRLESVIGKLWTCRRCVVNKQKQKEEEGTWRLRIYTTKLVVKLTGASSQRNDGLYSAAAVLGSTAAATQDEGGNMQLRMRGRGGRWAGYLRGGDRREDGAGWRRTPNQSKVRLLHELGAYVQICVCE
jgi:hypothetical protein